MKIAIVLLSAMLIGPAVMRAAQTQEPDQAEELTLSVFILALRIPTTISNLDGSPMTTGPAVWLAIKNTTATPYSLCTTARGWSLTLSGAMSGGTHCSAYWILLPGETHFETLNISPPQEPETWFAVSVILEGKPLGSTANLGRWRLSWNGTVAEATALGEKMKAPQ